MECAGQAGFSPACFGLHQHCSTGFSEKLIESETMKLRSPNLVRRLVTALFVLLPGVSLFAQQPDPATIQAILNSTSIKADYQPATFWWDETSTQAIGLDSHPVYVDINRLVELALANSAQIQVYSQVPLIRETAQQQALAGFDWVHFAETMWNDTSDPVGSSLTVGGAGTRYLNNEWTAKAGLRKRTWSGGELELSQGLGWQDTNSNFFIPNDQGTARLALNFTQPLMRGRGQAYNQSLIVLACIDVNTANEEFKRQLQAHLLEVVRGYWALYLERANLAQKVALFVKTQSLVEELTARQHIDAGTAQLSSARAALEARRSDLVRARTAVENAETRLRSLINAPELEGAVELVPQQLPLRELLETSTLAEVVTAVVHRPEINAAMQEIKAGCIRENIACHEMMPMLNLVTRSYVAGLQGNSDVFGAWSDQFSEGQPSYAVGLQYELPVGRRAARANLHRRQIEVRQLQEQYRTALENVKAEVEVAVRELQTSYQETQARYRSMEAAQNEAETLDARWRKSADDGSGALNLQALLQAQERLTESEFEFTKAVLTYNLSLINLQKTNGTMLEAQSINH